MGRVGFRCGGGVRDLNLDGVVGAACIRVIGTGAARVKCEGGRLITRVDAGSGIGQLLQARGDDRAWASGVVDEDLDDGVMGRQELHYLT